MFGHCCLRMTHSNDRANDGSSGKLARPSERWAGSSAERARLSSNLTTKLALSGDAWHRLAPLSGLALSVVWGVA